MHGEAFRIHVPDAVLADLAVRLERTRWTTVGAASGWANGTDREYLHALVNYWRTGYDWRAREDQLGALDHRKANVSGTPLHFIHVPARDSEGVPLLLLHGWPDSFFRFHKVSPAASSTSAISGTA